MVIAWFYNTCLNTYLTLRIISFYFKVLLLLILNNDYYLISSKFQILDLDN
ncbi:hypothetical protein RINTHM_13570 [Richelia intracellularis HM01]|nr:hypothetical protein RINTHM_13570 [Richelia intracellularis HM01]